MASRVSVSECELLDEIRASLGVEERKPGFYSIPEMAEQLNCSAGAVRLKVLKMQREGRLDSMRVKVLRSDGVSSHVTVYRLKKAKR
jgi:hypothetical protein